MTMSNADHPQIPREKMTGRPLGSRNKITRQVREFMATVACDPEYQQRVLSQARAGTLHPSIERFILESVAGRPTIKVEVDDAVGHDLYELSARELMERAAALREMAARAAALEPERAAIEEDEFDDDAVVN